MRANGARGRGHMISEAQKLRASKNDGHLVLALMAMTVVTGLDDAISFLGFGRVFTANMTGNVVLLGFAVAGGPGLAVRRPLTSLIEFLVGAVMGRRLSVALVGASRRRWLLTLA